MGFKRPLVQIQSLGPEKVLKSQDFRTFSIVQMVENRIAQALVYCEFTYKYWWDSIRTNNTVERLSPRPVW